MNQIPFSEQGKPVPGDGLANGYTYVPGLGFVFNNPEEGERRHLRYVANHVGLAMIFYIVLSVFSMLPLVMLFSAVGLPIRVNFNTMQIYGTQVMLQTVNLVVLILKLGVPALYLRAVLRRHASFAGMMRAPRAKTVSFALPMVLAASVIGAFIAEMLQNLLTQLGFYVSVPGYILPGDPLEAALSVALLIVVPVFLEEYLFRGVILQGMRCFGDGVALVASSVLFALAHFNAMQSANAMLMGLVIGYFVLRTRSLWTGIILHFIVNVLSYAETMLFRTVLQNYSEFVGNMVSLVLIAIGIVVFLLFIRGEHSAFTIPAAEKSLLTASKRTAICYGSAAMVLMFLLYAAVLFQMV